MNASLASIRAGLRPVVQQTLDGVEYFRFRNGQVRRQIGQGHSRVERAQRRLAKRERRTRLQLKQLFAAAEMHIPDILARLRKAQQLATDKAALASL